MAPDSPRPAPLSAPSAAWLTTGTSLTGELWTELTTTPIEVPTIAPPMTSVMKWYPDSTRAKATHDATPTPAPSNQYGLFDLGCRRCSVMKSDVTIENGIVV